MRVLAKACALVLLSAAADAQSDLASLLREVERARSAAEKARHEAFASGGVRAVLDAPRDEHTRPFIPRFQQGVKAHRGTPRAIPYLVWLLGADPTPRNATAKGALSILLTEHMAHAELESAVLQLLDTHTRVGAKAAGDALTRIREESPHAAVRGAALFATAAMAMQRPNLPEEETEKVITTLREAVEAAPDANFAPRAKACLFELERLQVGMTVPDIEGVDQEGDRFKLSDYRGKVILLNFWSLRMGPCRTQRRARAAARAHLNQPFAMLGVNCDADLDEVKAFIEEKKIAWRTFCDGENGEIARTWNIRGWPTIFVIDHQGVIKFKAHYIDNEFLNKLVLETSF